MCPTSRPSPVQIADEQGLFRSSDIHQLGNEVIQEEAEKTDGGSEVALARSSTAQLDLDILRR